MQPTINKRIEKGIKNLLLESLQLDAYDKVFLIVQDDRKEIGKSISKVAKTLKIESEVRYFNSRLLRGSKFPTSLYKEIINYDGGIIDSILLAMEWSEETTGGRLKLLRNLMNTPNNWKIGSMPGFTFKDFTFFNFEYDNIKKLCSKVFKSLVKYDHAEIITTDNKGKEYILDIDINNQIPIISIGIVDEGKWANVPSGETFCLPRHTLCNGTICIKGSIPNLVLKYNQWITLEIKSGKIDFNSIKASSQSVYETFIKLFFNSKGDLKYENASSIAELGIGTNENIKKLTGIPLFDEKILNTMHIGFGSNHQFNGNLKSPVHHDVTITNAVLKLKTKNIAEQTLIKSGKLIQKSQLNISENLEKYLKQRFKVFRINKNRKIIIQKDKIKIQYINTRNSEINVKMRFTNLNKGINDLVKGKISELPLKSINSKEFHSRFIIKLILHKVIIPK